MRPWPWRWRLPFAFAVLWRPLCSPSFVTGGSHWWRRGIGVGRVTCAAKEYGVLRRLLQLQDDFLSLPKTKEFVLDRDWPENRVLDVEAFLQRQELGATVLDVRSPQEFAQGHLAGAKNLPLLDDDERVAVGTTFVQIGAEEAFDLALQSVHPKLATLLRQADDLVGTQKAPRLLLYCKRGGMRSQSMAKLLSRHGFDVMVLQGGYKAFRTWAEQILGEKPQKVCVIAGATGSGKTEVLEEIQRLKLGQVINLEAMACHKGSVFGALGEDGMPPSSEQLRNNLAMEWSQLCSSKWVYLEDEGARIGNAVLPSSLYQRLRGASLVVHLDVAFMLRATRSLQLYGPFGAEALCAAVENFRHHMGHKHTDELQEQLRRGELRPVCEEILRNYDKAYDYHLNRGRSKDQIVRLEVDTLNCSVVAMDVVSLAQEREASAPEEVAMAPRGRDSKKDAQVREAKCYCGIRRPQTYQ